jgi:chromosome partitioning protein
MNNIIAVVNQKGGVGKTTTVVNVGKELAIRGNSVLLIEGDPQCDMTDLLFMVSVDSINMPEGVVEHLSMGRIEPGISNSCGLFVGEGLPIPVTKAFSTGTKRNQIDHTISVLPSTSHLLRMESEDNSIITTFQEKVRELATQYDYVVIDTPPALGNLQTAALAAAHQLIITTDLESLSVKNVIKLLDLVTNIRAFGNQDLNVLGILKTLTKNEKSKTKVMKHFVAELDEDYGDLVFKTEITGGTDVSTANAFGMAVVEYKPKSKQAIQYGSLADEVISKMGLNKNTSTAATA